MFNRYQSYQTYREQYFKTVYLTLDHRTRNLVETTKLIWRTSIVKVQPILRKKCDNRISQENEYSNYIPYLLQTRNSHLYLSCIKLRCRTIFSVCDGVQRSHTKPRAKATVNVPGKYRESQKYDSCYKYNRIFQWKILTLHIECNHDE